MKYEKKETISIYELFLMNSFSKINNNSSGANFGNVLIELSYDSKLNKNDKSKELQSRCEELGAVGWVICPFWEVNLSKGETIPNTWHKEIENNSTDDIAVYFTKDNYNLLINIIGHSRHSIPIYFYNWINEAEKLFFERRYISCAMMLAAILEGCIRNCPINAWRNKVIPFYEEVVMAKMEDIYKDEYDKLLNKFYEYLVILPSLNGFINSFFKGGRPFDKQIEPNYLERNWLMHGMTRRRITEVDCIKLFNAIEALAFLTEITKLPASS